MEETERERQKREKKESQTWDEQIQPVLDNCKDSVQGYRCYKLEYSVSNRQLYMIERLMDAQCNSLNEVSERRLVHHRETTFLDLLEYLHDRRPEEIRSGYKDIFWRFFKILHDKKLLPYFLEYLRLHPLPWAGKHSNQDLERQKAAKPSQDELPEEKKRKRRYSIPYENCRKLARKLWAETPRLKTADVIGDPKMASLCLSERKDWNFTDKTIRRWIQDLRPGFQGKKT